MSATTILAAALIGYALGSIPFGLLLTHFAGLGDIRKVGSGNIGATNVLRTGHKGLAAATLLLDMLKGTAAVVIAGQMLGPDAAMVAGAAAFLGHIYPVWLNFNGGKGVATYIGVALGLHWPAAVAFCAVWIAVAATTRYSSLSALIGSLTVPVMLLATGYRQLAIVFLGLTILLIYKHRANIRRLMAGEESKIGAKS